MDLGLERMSERVKRLLGIAPPERRALILGCGPAGLFAAHAFKQEGWTVAILSKKRKSELFGAQYLHEPIPNLTPMVRGEKGAEALLVGHERRWIQYQLRGSGEDYARKVYPNGLPAGLETSPEVLPAEHWAYDLRSTYDEAWRRYSDLVVDFPGMNFEAVQHALWSDTQMVASTIPAPDLCATPGAHVFRSQDIWALGDAPERGQDLAAFRFGGGFWAAPDTVVCDASRDVGWYRLSNIFGYKTVEWPANRKPPIPGVAPVRKPLSTDCDCHYDNARLAGVRYARLGRYGRWEKGYLTHHAYADALILAQGGKLQGDPA